MHEFSLLTSLCQKINEIAKENPEGKIMEIGIKLGALTEISPAHLQEHFSYLAKDTVFAGAKLLIEKSVDQNDPYSLDILLQTIRIAND